MKTRETSQALLGHTNFRVYEGTTHKTREYGNQLLEGSSSKDSSCIDAGLESVDSPPERLKILLVYLDCPNLEAC
jgi:hypothetical protein